MCCVVAACVAIQGALWVSAEELYAESDMSIIEPCGLSVDELQSALHEPLSEYAECFLIAENDTGINAVFLASIAALESGLAKYCANDNNIFGYTNLDGYMSFESVSDCIEYVSKQIKKNYLSEDGIYFKGYSIDNVCYYYNGSQKWTKAIEEIMLEIYSKI